KKLPPPLFRLPKPMTVLLCCQRTRDRDRADAIRLFGDFGKPRGAHAGLACKALRRCAASLRSARLSRFEDVAPGGGELELVLGCVLCRRARSRSLACSASSSVTIPAGAPLRSIRAAPAIRPR